MNLSPFILLCVPFLLCVACTPDEDSSGMPDSVVPSWPPEPIDPIGEEEETATGPDTVRYLALGDS